MKELARRLLKRPGSLLELAGASFMATLFGLSTALFAMQVLRRYIAVGVDGTLLLLTLGTVGALLLLLGVLSARAVLAQDLCRKEDADLEAAVLARAADLNRAQDDSRSADHDPLTALTLARQVQGAVDGASVIAILDGPFSLLLVGAVAWIHPLLGALALAGSLLAALLGAGAAKRAALAWEQSQEAQTGLRRASSELLANLEAMRTTLPGAAVDERLGRELGESDRWRTMLAGSAALFESRAGLGSALSITTVYAASAVLAVSGAITVAEFIGASILAGRAAQVMVRFVQTRARLARADQAMAELAPHLEAQAGQGSGTRIVEDWSGGFSLEGLRLRPRPGRRGWVADLDLQCAPGTVCLLQGGDGWAATELLRILAGWERPAKGRVLVQGTGPEGIDFSDIDQHWWRQQVMVLEQEPVLLNLSIAETLQAVNPDLDESAMARIIGRVGLTQQVFGSPEGLGARIADHGRNLAKGLRKRLALARALANDGPLALLDEPLEGLDREGAAVVLGLLRELRDQGRTLVVSGNDPRLAELADVRVVLEDNAGVRVETLRPVQTTARIQARPLRSPVEQESGELVRDGRSVHRARWFCNGVLAGCAALVLVAAWLPMGIAVQLRGEVTPSLGVARIEHLEGGIVAEILVREGDRVEPDQVLVVMEQTAAGSNVGELRARLRSLGADMARLAAEIQGLAEPAYPEDLMQEAPGLIVESRQLYSARASRMSSEIAAQEEAVRQARELAGEVEARLAASAESLSLLEREVALSAELLADQLTTRQQHLRLRRELAALQGQRRDDELLLARSRMALDRAEQELAALKAGFRAEALEELAQDMEEADQVRVRLEQHSESLVRTEVRSPMRGVVQDLFVVNAGEVVEPGETILRIVPTEQQLVVEARLPLGEVGYVRQGQAAEIRLASPDAGLYEPMPATVERVSPDAVRSPEGLRFYRMRLVTDRAGFTGPDGGYTLYPGMAVRVSVLIGERSLLEYLVSPYFLESAPQ